MIAAFQHIKDFFREKKKLFMFLRDRRILD